MNATKRQLPPMGGGVAPGFEAVRAEFERNFVQRGELGAACAVYWRGARVVDLWGGYCDGERQRPWQEDTLVLVFSVTKGLAALTMLVARAQGLLDYDRPVAAYWPEFAQNGKAHITIRQLLAHQAGLSAIDERITPPRMADLDWLADAIARQAPSWEPGTRHGYHYLTIGWCQAELIRRVDPRRRSLGRFFQEEVARPLGIEFYIGLPPEVSPRRVADIESFTGLQMLQHLDKLPRGMVEAFSDPGSLTNRTVQNPRLKSTGLFDSPEYRAIELPAGGGIGRVRDVARTFAALAAGGRELGITAEVLAELAAPAPIPSGGNEDLVWHVDVGFALGFLKPSSALQFGRNDTAFGSAGAGGSFAFGDPDAQVGFAYAPNKLGFYVFDDPRERALREAFYHCLARLEAPAAPGA